MFGYVPHALPIRLRRAFKLRQQFDHLYGSMPKLASEPSVQKELRPAYDRLYYSSYNGPNVLEHWRNEYRETIRRIVNAGPFHAQRSELFRQIVICTTWIALYERVSRDDPPTLWNGFFSEEDRAFDEQYHFDLLLRKYLLAFPTWVNLQVLGSLAYALKPDDEIGIELYMMDRKDYIQCTIEFNRAQHIAQNDCDEFALIIELRPEIERIVEQRLEFNTEIMNALISQSFKTASFRERHDRFVLEHNEAFAALGITIPNTIGK